MAGTETLQGQMISRVADAGLGRLFDLTQGLSMHRKRMAQSMRRPVMLSGANIC